MKCGLNLEIFQVYRNMMYLFFVCTVIFMQYVIVQCLIPGLIVKKLDKTLIARKRQDTMDMCRLFTVENEKLRRTNHAPKIIKSYRKPSRFKRDLADMEEKIFTAIPRSKRSVTPFAVNPALNAEDAKRVENIVNKLYDDMEERGERVTYRQMKTSTSSIMGTKNQTFPSRRFDFAPAFLAGPQAQLNKEIIPDNYPFPSKARWRRGIVPYFIDPKTYDAHLQDVIMAAFDYVEKATCIRLQKLREKPIDQASMEKVLWLYISNPTGLRQCVHSNERRVINGVQLTVFGYDCMSLGDIVHEVMHILGYSHEHLRSDRDQHISVLWDNIKPGYKKYFDLNVPLPTEYELESLPYDYSSIMHYPARAFSKNGQSTIMTESGIKIGQREGLSEIDVEKVALIYSNECVSRNREYLLQTCPTVVKSTTKPANVTTQEIKDYFEDRLWKFGLISYKLRDKLEFTVEERANINAVFKHIEQETCLQFRDVGEDDESEEEEEEGHQSSFEGGGLPNSTEDKEETRLKESIEHVQLNADLVPESEVPNEGTEVNQDVNDDTENHGEAIDNNEDGTQDNHEDEAHENNELGEQDNNGEEHQDNNEGEAHENNELGEQNNNEGEHQDNNEEEDQDQNVEMDEKQKAEIVITQPELRQQNKNNVKSNKRKDILRNMKKYNITVKKDLLRQAMEKKWKKRFVKRTKRDTSNASPPKSPLPNSPTKSPLPNSPPKSPNRPPKLPKGPTRRHSSTMLELRRSADPGCECPEPGAPKSEKALEIGAGCFNSVNDLLHFFVHVLGLDHQHNMHDRDNYLYIVWKNLTKDVKEEMQNKLPPAASVGFQYDYQSVMHYPWLQIKDGKTNVMYPIWNDGWAMGHWQGLSSVDVQKLNMLYFSECAERMWHDNKDEKRM